MLQIFYVIEGAVECKVHRASFVLATGGMFMVPRGEFIYTIFEKKTFTPYFWPGNQYYIKNICEREVKIFFAQARKIEENDMEAMPGIISRASVGVRPNTAPRSVSHGGSPK